MIKNGVDRMVKCMSCIYYILIKNVSETCKLLDKSVLAGRDIICEHYREKDYCSICKKEIPKDMMEKCSNCGEFYCKGKCFEDHYGKEWCY